MTQVLYSTRDVHTTIKQLLTPSGPDDERVVIAPFIGKDATGLLRSPEGMRIVCTLAPGATSARALKRLQTRGAQVSHAARLHMKVYWSKSQGCLVTSANVSKNALGPKGLKEVGVLLPAGQVDIDRLLTIARAKPITTADLRKLEKENARHAAALARAGFRQQDSENVSFEDWMESFQEIAPWKLGWWEAAEVGAAQEAKSKTKSLYGEKSPVSWVNYPKSAVREGDWLLSFEAESVKWIEWFYVDFVVQVPPSDKAAYVRGYSHQAVQASRINSTPPFEIDPPFRKALRDIGRKLSLKEFYALGWGLPPVAFKQELLEAYKRNLRSANR